MCCGGAADTQGGSTGESKSGVKPPHSKWRAGMPALRRQGCLRSTVGPARSTIAGANPQLNSPKRRGTGTLSYSLTTWRGSLS